MSVRFDGFTANTDVTLFLRDGRDDSQVPIGASTSDAHGRGIVEGVVPRDFPIAETWFDVIGEDGCSASSYFVVLGSAQVASIDDNSVVAGQLVTLRAGGFAARSSVSVTFDSVITQGECSPGCRVLRSARTSAVGSAVIRTRIPRDASLGPHVLVVNGDSADGISEFSMGVDITVVGGSTLPPTDTV